MTPEHWEQIRGVLENAMGMTPPERAVFVEKACGGDQALRQEVEALLASHDELAAEQRPEFLNGLTLAVSAADGLPHQAEPWIGRAVGPYQIIEQIGAGGMGEVYRAVRDDAQYQKQVAVKLVRAGQDSGLVASRFKNERQILASLDHPNIGRLLDGGTTQEGVPYLIMELIAGQPIDDYCDHHRLDIAHRLGLFLKVCSAVEYAHSRLIVHRDLKPSNILVTTEGVPKLLDFGIAKILDPGAFGDGLEATMTLLRVLTPGYASPEQVRGETITTASDVYSLGVVLYELLTGHHPYRVPTRTADAISRAVLEFEPEKPSSVVRRSEAAPGPDQTEITPAEVGAAREGTPDRLSKRLLGDLDNIVLMALRKEPERRYVSVERFAEDIRRHLENRPVLARQDTFGYRTSKFISRHRAAMAVAVLATVALLFATGVTLREARIARAERVRAERRFNDVRALANSLMFEIHDGIRNLPGSTPVRKLLVERALQYLDSLAQESRGDTALQRELAAAYTRIGEVQGSPFSANLGDIEGAVQSYQKALAISRSLADADPGSLENAVGLAQCYRLLSNVLLVGGETATALEDSRRAVQTSEEAARTHSKDRKLLQELQRDYATEADILASTVVASQLGDISSASPLRRQQLDLAEQLAALEPSDAELQHNLATSIASMGDQLILDGRRREAKAYYVRAQKMLKELAIHSQSTNILHHLHDSYYALEVIEVADGNISQAITSARSALEIANKLSLADPQNTQISLALAADYDSLAGALSHTHHKKEAYASVERSLSILAELVQRNPKNTEFRIMQALRFTDGSEVFRRFGDYSRALQYNRGALGILAPIQAKDPTNSGARQFLAVACNRSALVLTRLQNLNRAAEMYKQALDFTPSQGNATHLTEDQTYLIADCYAGLGQIEMILAARGSQRGKGQRVHWKQACSWFAQSMTAWRQVKEPGLTGPDGTEYVPPSMVERQRAQCHEGLRGPK